MTPHAKFHSKSAQGGLLGK